MCRCALADALVQWRAGLAARCSQGQRPHSAQENAASGSVLNTSCQTWARRGAARVVTRLLSAASHSATVSPEAAARRLPSWLKATAVRGLSAHTPKGSVCLGGSLAFHRVQCKVVIKRAVKAPAYVQGPAACSKDAGSGKRRQRSSHWGAWGRGSRGSASLAQALLCWIHHAQAQGAPRRLAAERQRQWDCRAVARSATCLPLTRVHSFSSPSEPTVATRGWWGCHATPRISPLRSQQRSRGLHMATFTCSKHVVLAPLDS